MDLDRWLDEVRLHPELFDDHDAVATSIALGMTLSGDDTISYSGSECYAMGYAEVNIGTINEIDEIEDIDAEEFQSIMIALMDFGFFDIVWSEIESHEVADLESVEFSYILRPAYPVALTKESL